MPRRRRSCSATADVTPTPDGRVEVRRVYDDLEGRSGEYRVLDLAPSTALRRWYGHDPERYEAFSERYRASFRSDDALAALDAARGRT